MATTSLTPRVPVTAEIPHQGEPHVVLDVRVVTEGGGGPEKTILNSPRFLAGAGYRMLCAYMHPPGDPGFDRLRRRAEHLQATVLSVPDRGPLDWRVVTRLLAICRRERVAIWHGHDYKSNFLGLFLRHSWPMRLVTTAHGWVKQTRRTPLYYRIDRLCLPRYERVLCVSDDLHESALRCGVEPERCLLVENGIDTDQFPFSDRTDMAAAKAALGARPDRPLLGSVGRLSEEKGFDVLIHAADALVRSGIDLDLRIAGEGDDRPRLEALIDDLGRGDRFRLLGYRSDTIPIYRAMDVFALSSYREGLPNVLLEAMALGIPVVSTRVAGIPRLVAHERDGLLVEPGSPAALAGAIARLIGDAGMGDRLRAEARRKVESHFSFAARMQRLRAIYDELLARPGPPRLPQVDSGRPARRPTDPDPWNPRRTS